MNVLVVDDEKDVEALFRQRFRKEIKADEIDFAFVLSGEAALEYMDRRDREAVLILSDINMPGMSGLELLERIKRKFHEPPPRVMMITAYGDQENYDTAKRLGADDFLTKPLDFGVLKSKLKTLTS